MEVRTIQRISHSCDTLCLAQNFKGRLVVLPLLAGWFLSCSLGLIGNIV